MLHLSIPSPKRHATPRQRGLSFEELRKIFEQLDKDGSGAIDFREFLHLGREMETFLGAGWKMAAVE